MLVEPPPARASARPGAKAIKAQSKATASARQPSHAARERPEAATGFVMIAFLVI
jgi:hypothetical protein